ncbi:MAG TPA: hypothetical protein VN695_18585 [Streptosporangiaceae bacterium]|nr:hypothetical protein [Streptosporangiaceae bacterium]
MTRIHISSTNSKALIVGIALVATGGLISLCGMGIGGTAAMNAFRRWLMAQQEPPSQIVKRKISQAKAATAAGASAWQDGMTKTR